MSYNWLLDKVHFINTKHKPIYLIMLQTCATLRKTLPLGLPNCVLYIDLSMTRKELELFLARAKMLRLKHCQIDEGTQLQAPLGMS